MDSEGVQLVTNCHRLKLPAGGEASRVLAK